MHHLKGMEYGKAKVSGSIYLEGFAGVIRYVSSKVTELYTFESDEGEVLGYVYVREGNGTLTSNRTVLKVSGNIPEDMLKVADGGKHEEVEYRVEQDEVAQGSIKRPAGRQWHDVMFVSDDFDITHFIYTPVSEAKIRMERDLSWLAGKDYRILRTNEAFDEYVDLLNSLPNDTFIGLDTETTGLRVNQNKVDVVVGISMSHKVGFGVYIPLRQKYGKNIDYSVEEVMEKLRPIIDKHEPTAKPLVLHNAKFDWKVFKQSEIELNVVVDTYIRLGLINFGDGRLFDYDRFIKNYMRFGYSEEVLHDVYHKNQIIGGHVKAESDVDIVDLPSISAYRQNGLKGAIGHFYNYDVIELSDMFEKKTADDYRRVVDLVEKGAEIDEMTLSKLKTDIRAKENNKHKRVTPYDFRYAPQWFYEIYAPADGDFPLMLLEALDAKDGDWAKYDGALDVIEQIELSAVEVMGEQEYHGLHINVDAIRQLGKEAQVRLEQVEQSIYDEVGHPFNIGSGKELGDVLYNELGVPKKPEFRTKTGKLGTGSAVMEQIAQIRDDEGNAKFPIVKKLEEHSKIAKLLSAFYNSLPDLADSYGFINPNFNALGASTGRVSSDDPNIQQMPPEVRPYIIPDTDDYYFAVCDFSQVERRLMGGLSGEPAINTRFIVDKEADSHKQTYASMYNYPYEKVNSKQRKIGKTLNFATAYGIAKQGLALRLYNQTTDVHLAMAQDLLDTYDRSVPVYKKFVSGVVKSAKEKGYAETYFGRRRLIEEFDDKYYMSMSGIARESAGERAAGNMVVQGTAADIQKIAMARLRATWRHYGYYEDMVVMKMNVHDEVTYQVHKSIHPYITTYIMKHAMEVDLSKQGFPPLYMGMNVGENWASGKYDHLEAPVILLDEMKEKGREMLELPLEDRPVFDGDPTEFWLNEIIEFSARELSKELELGYKESDEQEERYQYSNISETHNNGRVATYSDYFGDLIGTPTYPLADGYQYFNDSNNLQHKMIIWAVILKDYKLLAEKHRDILLGAEPKDELIEALNRAKNHQVVNSDTAVILGWFKDFGEGVKSLTLDEDIVDYNFSEDKLTVIYQDNTTQEVARDGVYTLRTGGDEVEDEYISPKEQVAEALTFSGNVISWEMPNNDETVLEVIKGIMVDASVLEMYHIDVNDCNAVRVVLAGGSTFYISGWLMPEVVPILGKILVAYYSSLGYGFVEDELNKVAEKVFK